MGRCLIRNEDGAITTVTLRLGPGANGPGIVSLPPVALFIAGGSQLYESSYARPCFDSRIRESVHESTNDSGDSNLGTLSLEVAKPSIHSLVSLLFSAPTQLPLRFMYAYPDSSWIQRRFIVDLSAHCRRYFLFGRVTRGLLKARYKLI